jgi:hypothetical protein
VLDDCESVASELAATGFDRSALRQAHLRCERWRGLRKTFVLSGRGNVGVVGVRNSGCCGDGWPLFPGSGERVKDYSGLGRDWTEGGTLTADAPLAAVEHGLFTTSGTGSGTLLDRSVFTVINLAAGDSLQATYAITFTAGG